MADTQSPKPKIGNAELADKLAAFDYNKLTGDKWNEYLDLTIGKLSGKGRIESKKNPRSGGLAMNDLYDYEGYRVTAIIEHVDPDNEESKTLVTGIKLRKIDAEHTTRITAGRAKIMNEQVANFSHREPGVYYLLKKLEPIVKASPSPVKTTTNA